MGSYPSSPITSPWPHGLHSGIHFRSSSYWSMLLGEQVGLSVLQDRAASYDEPFTINITKFDGTTATISNQNSYQRAVRSTGRPQLMSVAFSTASLSDRPAPSRHRVLQSAATLGECRNSSELLCSLAFSVWNLRLPQFIGFPSGKSADPYIPILKAKADYAKLQ